MTSKKSLALALCCTLGSSACSRTEAPQAEAGGIGKARLKAVGVGVAKPIADNAAEAGRAKNRRVELVKA